MKLADVDVKINQITQNTLHLAKRLKNIYSKEGGKESPRSMLLGNKLVEFLHQSDDPRIDQAVKEMLSLALEGESSLSEREVTRIIHGQFPEELFHTEEGVSSSNLLSLKHALDKIDAALSYFDVRMKKEPPLSVQHKIVQR